MLKQSRKFGWIILLTVLLGLLSATAAWAEPSITIPHDKVFPKDKFAATQIFRNEGRIKGDLFVWAQTISENGIVEGDLIGGAQDISIPGRIIGNARIAGGTITMAGNVEKNINAFAGTISMTNASVVGGNLYAFAGELNLNGQVKGYTHLGGGKITLGGEFFGDVDINTDFAGHSEMQDKEHEAKLTVLPGTIIHGKLRYAGEKVDFQKGAQVTKFEWIKPVINPAQQLKKQINEGIWSFVRLIFTTAAYFFLGLLLIKKFPELLRRAGSYAKEKPFNALGLGLLALLSTIAAMMICIVLLVMSLLMSPAFGLIFGVVSFASYLLLFFLAPLPVVLWLGDRVSKQGMNPASRFGIGLVALNFGIFALELLAKIPFAGVLFGLVAFILMFGTICIGSGAIVRAVFKKNITNE